MHEIDVDIETYSSVSLKECGVYKYSESPDFEMEREIIYDSPSNLHSNDPSDEGNNYVEAGTEYDTGSICGITYEFPSDWEGRDTSESIISSIGYDPSHGEAKGKYYIEVSVYEAGELISGAKPTDVMDIIANDIGKADGTTDYSYSRESRGSKDTATIKCVSPMDDEPVYLMIYMESVNDSSIVAVSYTISGGYEDTYDKDMRRRSIDSACLFLYSYVQDFLDKKLTREQFWGLVYSLRADHKADI